VLFRSRAGRQGPGIAYRLWEDAGTSGMPPFDPPEIHESDLAPLVLECAKWGENEPSNLRWLDVPSEVSIKESRARLCLLGALDDNGNITRHGEAMAAMPLPPRLAHMLLRATEMGQGEARGKNLECEGRKEDVEGGTLI